MQRATCLISSTLLLAVLGLVSIFAATPQSQLPANSPTSTHFVCESLPEADNPFEPQLSTTKRLLEDEQRRTAIQYQNLHAVAWAMHQNDLTHWR